MMLNSERVAATIYHIFLAEDNSPDVFAQAKRIHSLVPYSALKNVIRYANPAAVMKGVLDLFLAQPFGARSLMQRIFSLALSDGVRATQKSIDALYEKIQEPALCDKIRIFTESAEELKSGLRKEAANEQMDLIVVLLRSPQITPELQSETIGRIFNAFVAYNNAVDNVSSSWVYLRNVWSLTWLLGRPGNAPGRRAFRSPQATAEALYPAARQDHDDVDH